MYFKETRANGRGQRGHFPAVWHIVATVKPDVLHVRSRQLVLRYARLVRALVHSSATNQPLYPDSHHHAYRCSHEHCVRRAAAAARIAIPRHDEITKRSAENPTQQPAHESLGKG